MECVDFIGPHDDRRIRQDLFASICGYYGRESQVNHYNIPMVYPQNFFLLLMLVKSLFLVSAHLLENSTQMIAYMHSILTIITLLL